MILIHYVDSVLVLMIYYDVVSKWLWDKCADTILVDLLSATIKSGHVVDPALHEELQCIRSLAVALPTTDAAQKGRDKLNVSASKLVRQFSNLPLGVHRLNKVDNVLARDKTIEALAHILAEKQRFMLKPATRSLPLRFVIAGWTRLPRRLRISIRITRL